MYTDTCILYTYTDTHYMYIQYVCLTLITAHHDQFKTFKKSLLFGPSSVNTDLTFHGLKNIANKTILHKTTTRVSY